MLLKTQCKMCVVLLLVIVAIPYASASSPPQVKSVAYSNSELTFPLPAPPIGGSSQPLAPAIGVLRVAVIAVQFEDINATVSISQIKQEWSQVNQYYQEVSYKLASLQVDVFGWYTLPYSEDAYGRNCHGVNDALCDGQDTSWWIARDAVQVAQHDVNFNNYDYYAFVHSGYGQESSRNPSDPWSVTYLGGVDVEAAGKTLLHFSILPELEERSASTVGVDSCELGHQLGIPDMYNTLDGESIMGPWTLCDAGLWNGAPAGSSPAHPDSWNKIQMGWISGSTLAVASSATVSNYVIDPTEVISSNVHAVRIPISNGPSSKYYLVEVRQHIGFDSALPSTGVLILHVDDSLTMGMVQVIDADPNVSGLRMATWGVGQTFTDTTNNVTISVISQAGQAYQVQVGRSGSQPPPPPQPQNQATYVQFTITKIYAQPNVITLPNTTVNIFIDITNQGTASATSVAIEIDLDGQLYTNLQVSIGSGASVETSFSWTSTTGTHTFKVTVDPLNTLNETNRTGNVATFTLSVGPTLTINVPVNSTSNVNPLWVTINSSKYNVTSKQLQVSVQSGTITIQIEPSRNTSIGTRQTFSGWLDGVSANPRQITINSNTQLTALFRTQYLLTVDPSQGTTSPSAWYDANSIATVTANAISNEIANTTRLVFEKWSGDYNSTSTSLPILMTKPVTMRANWIRQYYVSFASLTGSPVGAGWYNAGSTANVTVEPIVQFANGTRDIFTGWNITRAIQAPTVQLNVNSPVTLQALWKTQYLMQIASSYGTPSGSGWHDAGSVVPVTIQSQINYNNKTRRIFAGWTGDYSGKTPNFTLTANKPSTVQAQWVTQYQITFKASGLPNSTYTTVTVNDASFKIAPNQPYSAWYSQGETLNPTANQTVMSFLQFATWRDSSGASISNPLIVTGPVEYTAVYQATFPTGIPGFPIESVIVGIVTGFIAIGLTRERRKPRELTSKAQDR